LPSTWVSFLNQTLNESNLRRRIGLNPSQFLYPGNIACQFTIAHTNDLEFNPWSFNAATKKQQCWQKLTSLNTTTDEAYNARETSVVQNHA
jgi:hypothetical protein